MNSTIEILVPADKDVINEKKCLKERKHMCTICAKGFIQKRDLDRHSLIHSGEKPYECPTCQRRFNQKAHWSEHLKSHTDHKPFSCPTCSKQFRQRNNLNTHMYTHSGVKSYDCPACEKQFVRKGDMRRHFRIHSGIKPYECPECHRQFSDASSLRRHLKIHFNVKGEVCPTCQKQFTHKSSVERHIKRIHLKEKAFICDSCDKAFSVKYALIRHVRVHEEVKLTICNKPFAPKSDPRRRLKKHAKKKQDPSEALIHFQQHSLPIDGMVKQEVGAECAESQPNNEAEFCFEVPLIKQEWIAQDEPAPSCSYQLLTLKQEPMEHAGADAGATSINAFDDAFTKEETETYPK